MRGSTLGAFALLLVVGFSCTETTEANPAGQCCKLDQPSCNCFVIGTGPNGTCDKICDLGPTTLTVSTDERGCPRYVWSGTRSCLDRPPRSDAGDARLDCAECQMVQCAAERAACQADAASLKRCSDAVACFNGCADAACKGKCATSAEAPALALLQCASECGDCAIAAPVVDAGVDADAVSDATTGG